MLANGSGSLIKWKGYKNLMNLGRFYEDTRKNRF
jgi:hypothetical protein